MRIVGGQAAPYGLDISLKRLLEDLRSSLAEKSINLNICFNGKGTLTDFLFFFFPVLIFYISGTNYLNRVGNRKNRCSTHPT